MKPLDKAKQILETMKQMKQEIKEIESGVDGTIWNPSMSDLESGKIGFADIRRVKGEAAAYRWERLNQESFNLFMTRFRNKEAKEFFNTNKLKG